MSLRRYFQPATTLPTASLTQLSPNVLQEVNQAVGAALQPKENGGRRTCKRKYTTFTPEDRARIGKYASENGNAAAVKKFKATHELGEYRALVQEEILGRNQEAREPRRRGDHTHHVLGAWLTRAHRNAFIRCAM